MSDEFALPPGAWRVDPFSRVVRYVLDDPNMQRPDAFDEVKSKRVLNKDARHRTAACIDCQGPTTRRADRCWDCYIANRTAESPQHPVENPLRLHEPIDEVKVQSVIDGVFIRCSRPERLEVLSRWTRLGRTDGELVKLTGWNVARDRKYIKSLQAKEAA